MPAGAKSNPWFDDMLPPQRIRALPWRGETKWFATNEEKVPVPRLTLPTLLWLTAAFLSFLASVACWFFVDRPTGLYIGLWVPSILALGTLLNTMPRREKISTPAAGSQNKA